MLRHGTTIVTLGLFDCNAINTADALVAAYGATNSQLEIIDLKWNTVDNATATFISYLAGIADRKTKEGTTRYYDATIEGTIKVDGGHYDDDWEKLQFEEVSPSSMAGYKEAVTTIFNKPLRAFYKDIVYIRFADPQVETIAKTTWGDGIGVTYQQAREAVDSLPSFPNTITEFNELGLFTHIKTIPANKFYNFQNLREIDLSNISTINQLAFCYCRNLSIELESDSLSSIGGGAFSESKITKINLPRLLTVSDTAYTPSYSYVGVFQGCKSLAEVILTNVTTIGVQAFNGCSILSNVNIPKVVTIKDRAFDGCSSLNVPLTLPMVKNLGAVAFRNTKITEFNALSLTIIPDGTYIGDGTYGIFQKCTKLTKVSLRDITKIGSYAFSGCSILDTVIIDNITPPSLSTTSLPSITQFYVPDSAVETYQQASGWSSIASRIHGMSELPTEE